MSRNIGTFNDIFLKNGDEPTDIGMAVNATWATAWPNVIARVWYEEHNGTHVNSSWYHDLFSCDSERVTNALKAEGFIVNSSEIDQNVDKYVNLNIAVKRREDGVNIISGNKEYAFVEQTETLSDNYSYNNSEYNVTNGWQGVQRIEHSLVLTIPPKPEKAEEFAVAIADYQAGGKVYPFTWCVC